MIDLLQTGKAGLLSNQHYLSTTSNNIANVNTVGYTRQETLYYTNTINWGIGESYTRRIYDSYVQREMFRDQGSVAFFQSYTDGMSSIDKMLSDKDMSVSTSFNNFFSSLQEAIQDPQSTAYRQEVLANLETIVNRFNTLNSTIQNQISDLNGNVRDTVSEINSLSYGIYELNSQIRAVQSNLDSDTALQLLDKRDQLINQLSSLVDINVTGEKDGTLSVYLGNGQLLTNGDTYATLVQNSDKFDQSKQSITLQFSDRNATVVNFNNDDWGGKLGGYLMAGAELRQTQRDLGKLAVAFADALNEQNKAGITLEGTSGQDLLSFGTNIAGVSSNPNFTMDADFIPGKGSNVIANDIQVTVDNNGTVTVYKVEGNDLIDITADVTVNNTNPLTIDMDNYGLKLSFNASANAMRGTKFVVQPTVDQGFKLELNATKPEDFAFASAVRVNTTTGNQGNAVIKFNGMTSIGPNNAVIIGNDNKPAFNPDLDYPAPQKVVVNADGDYEVYGTVNGAETLLGTAPASCNGKNVLANTVWDTNVVATDYSPGFDFDITGTVKENDSFTIEINEGGIADNSNGIQLGLLQSADKVSGTTGPHTHSFTEDYANLTTRLGSAIMSASNDLVAASAKCEQTQSLFLSAAGVNLDEEAANLIKFQQSYSACAKIITASQTVFDALINSI